MSSTKTIEIDIDVYKRIEGERLSFDEEPNSILRRLLNIDLTSKPTPLPLFPVKRDGWQSSTGAFLPNGTLLTMSYNGIVYDAEIRNGLIRTQGENFKSLSGAAGHLTGQSLNGWAYWFALCPGDTHATPVSKLRKDSQAAPVRKLRKRLAHHKSVQP